MHTSYNWYKRPKKVLENHPDEGLVKKTGYMNTKEMVEQFMIAGRRLEAFRNAEYQEGEAVPDDAPAFAFRNNLDAMLEGRAVVDRIKLRKEEAEKAKKEEEKKKEEEENKKEEK